MYKTENLIGRRFNRLLVIKEIGAKNKQYYWLCECDCGKIKEVTSGHLRRGDTQSCGCLQDELLISRKTTHGLTGNIDYNKWWKIKERCYNKNCKAYKNYGARGIKLSDEWVDDPQSFVDYIRNLENYGKDGYSLDRIDNQKGYERDNLRFATDNTQARNRRCVKFNIEQIRDIRKEYKDKNLTYKEVGIKLNVSQSYAWAIINNKIWADNE